MSRQKAESKPKKSTNYNVRHVIFFDLSSKIDIDFNSVLSILLLDGMQEGVEPLG